MRSHARSDKVWTAGMNEIAIRERIKGTEWDLTRLNEIYHLFLFTTSPFRSYHSFISQTGFFNGTK